MAVAYKVWYDTKHYIHKDSTKENVVWTEDIKQAKNIEHRGKAISYFFYELGFNFNARYDALRLL